MYNVHDHMMVRNMMFIMFSNSMYVHTQIIMCTYVLKLYSVIAFSLMPSSRPLQTATAENPPKDLKGTAYVCAYVWCAAVFI